MKLGTLAILAGAALFLMARKASGEGSGGGGGISPKPVGHGPPRWVGDFDRLPSLQAELAKREAAVAQAQRVIASRSTYAPPGDQMLADMRAIVAKNAPLVASLRAAIEEIHTAGQD